MKKLSEEEALELARIFVRTHHLVHREDKLVADRFEFGWEVFDPERRCVRSIERPEMTHSIFVFDDATVSVAATTCGDSYSREQIISRRSSA